MRVHHRTSFCPSIPMGSWVLDDVPIDSPIRASTPCSDVLSMLIYHRAFSVRRAITLVARQTKFLTKNYYEQRSSIRCSRSTNRRRTGIRSALRWATKDQPEPSAIMQPLCLTLQTGAGLGDGEILALSDPAR